MEVYGTLVWHTCWEYPSIVIKQRSTNDILTQRKEKKKKDEYLIYFFMSHSTEKWTLKTSLWPSCLYLYAFQRKFT